MRTHKTVYEVIISPSNVMKVTQFLTQDQLSDLLKRDNVRLICVNVGTVNRTPRKRKTVRPDPDGLQKRQEERLKRYRNRRKGVNTDDK